MKYLELFKNGFDETLTEKTKPENWPYIGYSPSEGFVFTVVPVTITGPADNEIWYTSESGNVVNPYKTDVFEANIVSNTYEDGKGVIKFDSSVTSIGEMAFYGCDDLTSVNIPNNVTSIRDEAFRHCSRIASITIPESVTNIGKSAFYDCSFTSVIIPNSVTSIGLGAFEYCSYLTSPVYNAHCFAYLPTSFEGTYTVPDGIKQIAGAAFQYCRALTSITIPNSVTSIGEYAFYVCESLTSVTIPNSVTSIGKCAFYLCNVLTSITFEGTIEEWNAVTKYDCWNYNVPATYVQCIDGQVEL